jgi:glycosyltransferase involved in cell wall biosynthesis
LDLSDATESHPIEVHHRIRSDVRADYAGAARALAGCGVDIVSIQHEYGIWGGEAGSYVLDFVRELRVPFVVTLHTVLRNPSFAQKSVLAELVEASDASVVMSCAAATLLARAYGVDPSRLEIVSHGVPNLPLVARDTVKPRLGLAAGPVILSFGLLGPGKGYESVIEAMPAVVGEFPATRYVVLGATHPDLLRREGEAYRCRLEARAAALGMSEHVLFVDRFVGKTELGSWLEAADVFVTPYPNLDQIVSGTLSYAMGAGKAIVSTPYAYAAEMLEDGRGLLVESGSPNALAEAFLELLRDEGLRAKLGRRAYQHTRSMLWPQVAERYRDIFGRVVAAATSAGSASVAATRAAPAGRVGALRG